MSNPTTVVTAFFDLSKLPGRASTTRDSVWYLDAGRKTLALDFPFLIFCAEEHVAAIQEMRGNRPTQFVVKNITEYDLYKQHIDTIIANRQKSAHYKSPDERNTPAHFITTTFKFVALETAVERDDWPETTHIAWLDFGAGKTLHDIDVYAPRALNAPHPKIGAQWIHVRKKEEIEPPGRWLAAGGPCGVQGSFFTLDKTCVRHFISLAFAAFNEQLSQGVGHTEEQILTYLAVRHPELFKFSFGDYGSVLKNYHAVVADLHSIKKFVLPNAPADLQKQVWQAIDSGRQSGALLLSESDTNELKKYVPDAVISTYEHDVALLRHAHYVNEFECGRRAASRLLTQSLPDEIENWVRAQQTLYTPTLAECNPVEFRRIDIKPFKPGWSLFNPTLFEHAGQLVGLVRSSNYVFDGRHYTPPPEDKNAIRTKSIFVTYDADFRVVSAIPLEDPEYQRTGFTVEGLEDARLYTDNGVLAVSATIRDAAPHDGRCRIGTAQLDIVARKMHALRVPEAPSNRHEKNWMPIVGQDRWLYSCNVGGNTETVALRDTGWERTITAPAPVYAKHFRGGSQLVPFQSGYLSLVHEVAFDADKRIYSHRFVWFDAQLRLTKYSAPFFFRVKRAVEFAAGLAVRGDSIVASFGVNDKQAWLAILPAAAVTAQLNDVV